MGPVIWTELSDGLGAPSSSTAPLTDEPLPSLDPYTVAMGGDPTSQNLVGLLPKLSTRAPQTGHKRPLMEPPRNPDTPYLPQGLQKGILAAWPNTVTSEPAATRRRVPLGVIPKLGPLTPQGRSRQEAHLPRPVSLRDHRDQQP